MLSLDSFRSIRSWNGSQPDAFEELCYQLRDPTPDGAILWKVGNPDRGYEWFVRHEDDTEWGWQVKYTFGIDDFLKLATDTLETVVAERPNCVRLTFCIPFDLPDVVPKTRGRRTGSSAVEKFERWRDQREAKVPGSERIEILLWPGGDLLTRLNDPSNRGRAWFFWDQDVLSLSWCRQRVDSARAVAGPRYSEELHIEMPIAAAIDGLARAPRFRRDRKLLQTSFNSAANGLLRVRFDDALREAIQSCRAMLARYADADAPAAPLDLRDALQRCVNEVDRVIDECGDESVSLKANSMLERLFDVQGYLRSGAAQAAHERALIVTGDAGQGKTHLFVDAAYRLLRDGQPTALIMGSSLTGSDVLSELSRRLGMETVGWVTMLQAMASAAEAYERPFVLLLDGINESDKARGWQTELPTLLAEIRHHAPWIVVAVSVRTTYRDIVLGAAAPDLPTVEHQGFAGVEQLAAETFFAHYQLPAPQLPLVGQDMSNPLFLKLYCETVQNGWSPPANQRAITVSTLFDRYLDKVNQKVSRTLELDESDRLVQRCMSLMAKEFTEHRQDWIPRSEAKEHITALASHLQSWPRTLFGELLSEGLLSADIIDIDDGTEFVATEVVKLSYQRFSDYMIAEEILSTITTVSQLAAAASTISASSSGVIEALSVLIPERFGVELLKTTTWNLDPLDQQQWHEAFLRSLPTRSGDAITTDTVELFEQLAGLPPSMRELAAQTLVELSVHPGHRLDVDYLHRLLDQTAMPERDASWGISLYHNMNAGALGRIIRWAARPDHENYPHDVVERVAIVLVWMLGTPHRPMRDHITKTLSRLLSHRLDILKNLYERFSAVDDPYIFERLCVITHGALITSETSIQQDAVEVVRCMAAAVARRSAPDLLARDALNGTVEWCVRAGMLDRDAADQLPQSARSPLTLDAPTESELFAVYGPRATGSTAQAGYSSILMSICGLGDFGVKVVGPDVRHFSRYPVDEPYPSPPPPPAQAALDDIRQRLAALQSRAQREDAGDKDPEENSPRTPDQTETQPRTEFPDDSAKTWIFRRVLQLGWTPQLFAEFDATISSRGREGHKPERFGKKYQWIALRELLARIADNYHPRRRLGDNESAYRGAWQIHGRDIDPTLPPSPLLSSTRRQTRFETTFPTDDSTHWWLPDGPDYRRSDPPADCDWAARPDGIVEIEPHLKRFAPDGSAWVVLHSTHNWEEEDPLGGEDPDRNRRQQGSHIYSWLVAKSNTSSVYKFLSENSLMGRWMPEGSSPTSVVYLGEMPWGASANEYPQEWDTGHGAKPLPKPVYPTWNEYCWESVVLDCSIDEAVNAWMPSLELFEAGQLTWLNRTRQWLDADRQVTAQYLDTADQKHAALLVRHTWLTNVLESAQWSIVFGHLGEKQLFSSNDSQPGLAGDWTEIDTTAVLYGSGTWKFGHTRTERRHLE
ncbi:ATP-binding protein [Rhodococcus sp. USK10]|uniref:ATP-binding protein n=1 Tax=Rhodococcus sp. USK10 TaxID=2789739 RepID=UPI001C5ED7FB|nr:ATP-binding protein [Rhodococcus sp. USK10]QYB04263.1 ATP-binding protein [Rhodococcus sp. USK10]